MIHESQLRRRFLAEDVPHRLGQLSSTLSRLSDFMLLGRPVESVLSVMDEAIRFVRWTHGDVSVQTAVQLEQVAGELQAWRGAWPKDAPSSNEVSRRAALARAWSEKVLEMSGLLTPET